MSQIFEFSRQKWSILLEINGARFARCIVKWLKNETFWDIFQTLWRIIKAQEEIILLFALHLLVLQRWNFVKCTSTIWISPKLLLLHSYTLLLEIPKYDSTKDFLVFSTLLHSGWKSLKKVSIYCLKVKHIWIFAPKILLDYWPFFVINCIWDFFLNFQPLCCYFLNKYSKIEKWRFYILL